MSWHRHHPVRFAVDWRSLRTFVGALVLLLLVSTLIGIATGLGLTWLGREVVGWLAT